MKQYPNLKRLLVFALAAAPVLNCGGSSSKNTDDDGGTGGSASGGGGTGGSAGTSGSAGSDAACQVDSDCGWGEIERDILRRADCPCLFGCPSLPQNVEIITRRQEQYDALCDPQRNGQGDLCPIDDCIQPPELRCINRFCTPPT